MKYDVVRIAGGVKTYDEVEAEDRDRAASAVKRERHLVTLTAAAPTQSFYREDDGASLGTNDPVAVIAVNDPKPDPLAKINAKLGDVKLSL